MTGLFHLAVKFGTSLGTYFTMSSRFICLVACVRIPVALAQCFKLSKIVNKYSLNSLFVLELSTDNISLT